MPSAAAELRAELRALRKEHVKPVSRMRMGDIAAEIQKLKGVREETPAPAAVPSAPIKKSKAAVESVKEAKKAEFPVMPAGGASKARGGASKTSVAPEGSAGDKKKGSKLAKLMALLEEDDE